MASEYTPTTEKVREYYVQAKLPNTSRTTVAIKRLGAEFDRWLAARDAELIERLADEMEGGFNPRNLNLERRQIKRWLRLKASLIREGKADER